jgi:hypothetical protein
MATLQYNQGFDWQLQSWRKIIKRTPKKNFKRLISGRSKGIIRLVESFCSKTYLRRKRIMTMAFILWNQKWINRKWKRNVLAF